MNKVYILAAFVAVFLASCGNGHPAAGEEARAAAGTDEQHLQLTDAQFKNAGIVTGRLAQREISGLLKLNGKVDVPPQNMVSVSVPLGGYLASTHLLPGMHVRKGEVIAVVQDQQYIQLQQDYLTAKARLGMLEKDYLRQKELNQSKATSDKISQQAEADYRADRILVNALAEKLKLAGIALGSVTETHIVRSINVVAPIDGFVSKVNINIGKYISPTDVLFELINPSDIHLALKVFEKDLDKLHVGQKLVAYTNDRPDKKYECSILLVSHDLSQERTADVHCHFDRYDKSLAPGMYMNAEITLNNVRAWVLPADAVVQFEGKSYVFRETGRRSYEAVEVVAGEAQDGFVQVTIPDAANADFVVNGAYSLLMMMKNKGE